MFREKPSTARAGLPKENVLYKLWRCLLLAIFFFPALLVLSVLAWPVLVGFEYLGDAMVPHATGSYLPLYRGLGHLRDLPLNLAAMVIIFMNIPLGFFTAFWYLILFGIGIKFRKAWRELPTRAGVLRRQEQRALAIRTSKHVAIATAVIGAMCLPFVSRYDILTQQAICVREAFAWNEQVYPLDRLQRIDYTAGRRGGGTRASTGIPAGWWLRFSDGRQYFMRNPAPGILPVLLRLPNVTSNARFVNGVLQMDPGR